MSGEPLFTIRVVAQLTGAHPQTIRLYETKGLVSPQRTSGGTRMYSQDDVALLQEIIDLSAAGVTHEGISRIIELREEIKDLECRIDMLIRQNSQLKAELSKLRNSKPQTAIVITQKPMPPAPL